MCNNCTIVYIGVDMEERKIKRVVLDVTIDLHAEIKILAARRNISMNNWLHRAIYERIAKEKREEVKE